jgi:hypothetical protein
MSSADFNGTQRLIQTLPAAQPWGVGIWARLTNASLTDFLPYFCGTAGSFLIGVHSGKWAYGSNSSDVDSSAFYATGAWAFMCLTRSGNNWSLYKDGVTTAIATGTNATDSSTSFVIGDSDGSGGFAMTGQLGPNFIYTAALTGAQWATQYAFGREPADTTNLWFHNNAKDPANYHLKQNGSGGDFTLTGTLGVSAEDPWKAAARYAHRNNVLRNANYRM